VYSKKKEIEFLKKKIIFVKDFWSDMVVPSNLSIGRIQRFWNVQFIMGDPPKWKTQRSFQSSFIVMSDLFK
jgi:hypothetical protein